MRLAGKSAIVTGAASGIGRASALLFAQEGAQVLGVDLPGAALDTLGASGVNVSAIDITGEHAPEQIVAAALQHSSGIDILFNNAGTASSFLAQDLADAEWDRVNAVNLRATFRVTRAAIPRLVQSRAGRIINTASVMAEGADYGLAAYCASKAGVCGLTRALALELGKHAVTVNALLPGAIRTGMTSGLWDARPEVADIWAKKAALRRLGEPADIARVALFLASEEAGFVTGQAIAVDGGLTLRI